LTPKRAWSPAKIYIFMSPEMKRYGQSGKRHWARGKYRHLSLKEIASAIWRKCLVMWYP
jgi:hypothetical protein